MQTIGRIVTLEATIDIWKILMRQLPLYLLILLLHAASPCRAAEGSTDPTWSQGLTWGVNGPIPVIVVDQFGYPTKAAKIAVIRDPQVGYDSVVHFTPGQNYAVVNRSTGAIIKRGTPTVWNNGATDIVSGDKAWWFDFSDVTIPGTYAVVDLDKGLRSVEFEINDRVYRSVLKHALRMYFYQRAGFEKRQQRPEPIGPMLRAICAPDKTLKPALGRLDACSPRAMFHRSRTSTSDGSTLATTTSTQVGRPALSLPCSELTTKTRMHSVTTVE